MIDADQETLNKLKTYSITIGMGFARLDGAEGGSTLIMDAELLEILIALGVPYSMVQPNAGLSLMEVGHDE